MLKIQYGIAGFFTGAFTGLLLALVERRLINNETHPGLLFIIIAITIIVLGIVGMLKGIRMADKKSKEEKK